MHLRRVDLQCAGDSFDELLTPGRALGDGRQAEGDGARASFDT
ncbi:hypothetical protein [Streptomyces sp. NPDC056948]